MKQFHLKYWGGVRNNGLSASFLETTESDFWFDTDLERAEFKARLEAFAESHHQIVVFDQHDGIAAQTRTVAVMVFKFMWKEYPFEYDFGVGYEPESGIFMFEDGNYACDCNRSIFLHEIYPEILEDMDCGYTIEMKSIKMELRPVSQGAAA